MLQYIPRSFLAGFIGVFVLTEFAWALGNTQAIESYQSIFFSITEWSSLLLDGLCWVLALIPYVLILLPVLFFAFASICYKKNQTDPLSTNENVHFTIIIPAYNEEKVILNSVNSMLKQNYPQDSFRVVVAFNGNDRSGQLAQEAGALVFTTPKVGVGKRNAINYVLEHLTPRIGMQNYILVIDADNMVKPDFLLQMAKTVKEHKAIAVQGNHQPLIVDNNWISLGLSAAYRASSLLYNEGRSIAFHSALLCGTGFALREDVFRDLWPKTKTLTEDIELNGLLQQFYGAGVVWSREAYFYDEKPDNLAIAIRQRTRWMVGHFWCALLYAPSMIFNGIRQKNLRMIELGCYYLFPFALLGSVLSLILSVAMVSLHTDIYAHINPTLLISLSVILLFVYIFYVVVGDSLSKGFRQTPKRYRYFLRDALFSMAFALAVWPIAIIRATFMMCREDWIFHTPHKSVGYEQSTFK